MYTVCSPFHRRHYGGKKANDSDHDSDNDNDITKYHLVQGAGAQGAMVG